MKQNPWIATGVALFAAATLFYFYPLFHIQPRGSQSDAPEELSTASSKVESVSPADFVEEFWSSPRRRGEGAIEVTQLWEAFDADAAKAKAELGRQAGLGGAWYFLVRGEGTVETNEKSRVLLAVSDSSRKVEITLGVIVGNTVREAIAVDVNQFANSQDFNALSTELNRRVEQDTIGASRDLLQAGAMVKFVGCAKVGSNSDLHPLRLVPLDLVVSPDAKRPGKPESTDASTAGSSE